MAQEEVQRAMREHARLSCSCSRLLCLLLTSRRLLGRRCLLRRRLLRRRLFCRRLLRRRLLCRRLLATATATATAGALLIDLRLKKLALPHLSRRLSLECIIAGLLVLLVELNSLRPERRHPCWQVGRSGCGDGAIVHDGAIVNDGAIVHDGGSGADGRRRRWVVHVRIHA